MHILLIKMSSMGDVIHTLPALTDAMHAIPDLKVDWVIESAFADIPTWHPAVNKVIPIKLRQWRKKWFLDNSIIEIKQFLKTVREKKYDLIIDAQGLLKSAMIAKLAHGDIHGFNKNSIKEKIASLFYKKTYAVNKNQHAVTRTRVLFSTILKYTLPTSQPDFRIDQQKLPALNFNVPDHYFVFIHGTTWKTKQYPEIYWKKLLEKAQSEKIPVYLPWGNEKEKERAEMLATDFNCATVLPALSIAQLATLLKKAANVITVDTGLGHLSAALSTRTIALYGPTDPSKVGMIGDQTISLSAQFPCAPCESKICAYAKKHKTKIVPACYTSVASDVVWDKVVS